MPGSPIRKRYSRAAVMAYRQAKPETRAAIIAYLKELN